MKAVPKSVWAWFGAFAVSTLTGAVAIACRSAPAPIAPEVRAAAALTPAPTPPWTWVEFVPVASEWERRDALFPAPIFQKESAKLNPLEAGAKVQGPVHPWSHPQEEEGEALWKEFQQSFASGDRQKAARFWALLAAQVQRPTAEESLRRRVEMGELALRATRVMEPTSPEAKWVWAQLESFQMASSAPLLMGALLLQWDTPALALEVLRRARQIRPTPSGGADVLSMEVRALRRLGRLQEAEELLEESLVRWEGSSELMREAGIGAWEKGDRELACLRFEQASLWDLRGPGAQERGSVHAWNRGLCLYWQGRLQEAVEALGAAPVSEVGLLEALCLRALGKNTEALQRLGLYFAERAWDSPQKQKSRLKFQELGLFYLEGDLAQSSLRPM